MCVTYTEFVRQYLSDDDTLVKFRCFVFIIIYHTGVWRGAWCSTLPSARQHPSYGDYLEVKREYYQKSSVLDCVTLCSQSAAHLYEQFLQVQQIGFVTFGPLRCA